ncbi:MAG: hypothetical protein CL484_02040 [Acidobacteria bacterium]|nr:hypothetical protein [Acidobacteriota bacterium]
MRFCRFSGMLLGLIFSSFLHGSAPLAVAPNDDERYQRGWYIAEAVVDCQGCHTRRDPPDFSIPAEAEWSGGELFGEAWLMPGDLVPPNLTPDKETGLGNWTTQQIKNAIRNGVNRDGERLFPLMPSHLYQVMSDRDLDALVYYLQSLPERKQPNDKKTKLKIKRSDISPLPTPTNVPEPPNDPIERGKYLLTLGNCLSCHSPTLKGQIIEERYLAGGVVINTHFGVMLPPNITPAEKTGIGGYKKEEFMRLMREGITRKGVQVMLNYMPWYVYKKMTDEDLNAMYEFLMSNPPIENDIYRPENQFPLGN